MLNNNQKKFLFKNMKYSKIIMLGDLGYQLPPIKGVEMTQKGFDNVVELTTNYRFKCEILKTLLDDMRNCIKNKVKVQLKAYRKHLNVVSMDEVEKLYQKDDLILVSQHWVNDQYNKMLQHIPKYKVTDNLNGYNNGEIVFEKIPKVKSEFRHGYTVHSIQGETHRNKLFIDMNDINSDRMLYTAISRAVRLEDVYFVKRLSLDTKKRLKKEYNILT